MPNTEDVPRTEGSHSLASDVIQDIWDHELALDDEAWVLAEEIAEVIQFRPDIPTEHPRVLAAISLYVAAFATDDPRSQPVLADAASVHVSAVRRNKDEVVEIIDGAGLLDADLSHIYNTDEQNESAGLLAGIIGRFTG